MNRWSYGFGELPGETLNESQGTADVKAAVNAMEKAYSIYDGLNKQVETNPNMKAKALQQLKTVSDTMKKAVGVINSYKAKLTTKSGAGKNMGGGLDDKVLNDFLSGIDKHIDELVQKAESGNTNANNAEGANNQQQGNNANQQQNGNEQQLQQQLQQAGLNLTPQQVSAIQQIIVGQAQK